MLEAIVTTKGQVTIPKQVRDALKIKDGSDIVFMLEHGEAVIMPKTKDPFKEMERLRTEISFTKSEIKKMIRESKKEWSRLD